ncbi:MAG TPA: hypothetical protein PKA58_25255 [Polyangium sp.]|nr:hypothetical protein [Polyangium sp.]
MSDVRSTMKRVYRGLPLAAKVLLWTSVVFVVAELGLRLLVRSLDIEHGLYQADAAAEWRTKSNLALQIDVNKPPLHFKANTNHLGLRGDGVLPPKAPGERRIVILGDSFTWGIGVESKQTFPEVLERKLAESGVGNVKIINAGMPSYGTVHELAFHRAYSAELGADAIVLAYYPNDDDDNSVPYRFLDGYIWRDPTLIFGQPSFVVELVVQRTRLGLQKTGLWQPKNRPDGRALSLKLIGEVQQSCAENHWPFFVLDIPARESTKFVAPFERATPFRPLDVSSEYLITMRDEIERLSESPYLEEHHLNPAGHELTARVLAKALSQRLPWATGKP